MSMSVAEARSEIASLYQKAAAIENKYPDGLTPDVNHEDFNEAKRLLGEIDGLEAKLQGLEDAEARKQRITKNAAEYSQAITRHQQPEPQHNGEDGDPVPLVDLGRKFSGSDEYKRLLSLGTLNNPRSRVELSVHLKGSLLDAMQRKALVYSGSGVGGPLIMNQRLPGYQEILQRELTLLDLIPTARTTSNMIEYAKELAWTDNTAAVAEATVTTGTTGLKPESGITFEEATSPVTTIATWMPITNAMLADAPQIRGIIDNRLLYGLNKELEDQILSGSGSGANLTGILNTNGIQTLGLAAGSTYGGAATAVDAAYAAMLQVQVTGLANPNAFVFNPIDWAAIRLMRENAATGTLGGYMYGPPSVSGPMTLWGRPVVLANGMTENTAVVADFQLATMLFDREQAAIRVGTIDDQFVRNMQTILAELRAAFVVFRPTAIARVTGV